MKVIKLFWNKSFTAADNRTTGATKFWSLGAFWMGNTRDGWMDIIILRSFQVIISPLLGFIIAVRRSRVLTKYDDFSVPLQIFEFTIKIVKVFFFVLLFFLLSNLLNSIVLSEGRTVFGKLVLDSFASSALLIMFAAMSCGAGVGYLFYVRKNYQFIWLAISFMLVIPAVVVFLYVLVLKAFPSLRKYTPQDGVGKRWGELK
ncbi:MAG: hypothetical protein A2921_01765 [Candidatus Magasanikbacteria bacterium RIFCSPLOWO2_01_FULL_43_20b]|uniref:Uncharacterized protein n=1 Tax=Candidatus Magasanikbacteria bacterium RIFCSPLOWO2_12_FULL_43_12 TaxID=1798692 RepID=A0A1F6MVU9_9BACT|nr:MAG: hypothetical protein A3I93_01225 [Candidatus Magasanikbacteria bacterium RIFCSPLOWO2_02_FULL_43_22]OGH73241.1 MAG: hypothetical protein A2921_01765 [Candidatus Magasanikbacteria bacterium RIFCSPLOWO2_01_FULL_43_20b]OGH75638.1 MAG: hypothetical protein A3G00_04040 [Candidatus Magasanikbacteria bacterium RIFCSPLOWO2_12_FULL_43_12]